MPRCPVCGAEAVAVCWCPRGDAFCPAGHRWFLCRVHNRVVVGEADHARSSLECSCGDETEAKP